MKRSVARVSGLFILLRVRRSAVPRLVRMYFTPQGTWSRSQAMARKGYYRTMKALMDRMKAAYPDLILERVAE